MSPSRATSKAALTRALQLLCDVIAGVGGVILLAIALITVASVAGRALFAQPILGDVELVQLGTAVCVACFLPFTQLHGGNIMVDFFTQRASKRTKSLLDAMGTLLYALVLALICWRVYAGGLAAHENQETSMLMGVPIWIPYLLMLPGLALAALIGLHQTVAHLRAARAGA